MLPLYIRCFECAFLLLKGNYLLKEIFFCETESEQTPLMARQKEKQLMERFHIFCTLCKDEFKRLRILFIPFY